jgi:hypothetical protein
MLTQCAGQTNSLIVLPLLLCLGLGRRRGSATLRQPRKRKVYRYCSYAHHAQLRFEIKRLVTLSEALRGGWWIVSSGGAATGSGRRGRCCCSRPACSSPHTWPDGFGCRPQLSGTAVVRVEPQDGRSVSDARADRHGYVAAASDARPRRYAKEQPTATPFPPPQADFSLAGLPAIQGVAEGRDVRRPSAATGLCLVLLLPSQLARTART